VSTKWGSEKFFAAGLDSKITQPPVGANHRHEQCGSRATTAPEYRGVDHRARIRATHWLIRTTCRPPATGRRKAEDISFHTTSGSVWSKPVWDRHGYCAAIECSNARDLHVTTLGKTNSDRLGGYRLVIAMRCARGLTLHWM